MSSSPVPGLNSSTAQKAYFSKEKKQTKQKDVYAHVSEFHTKECR
jgi:hypothetical protein